VISLTTFVAAKLIYWRNSRGNKMQQIFKEKGTKWVIPGKVLRVESGIAIAVNFLLNGEELNREVLSVGEILAGADFVFCSTDCSFSEIQGKVQIELSQLLKLSKLCVIREERLINARLKELFKYLIIEYSIIGDFENWIPLPFPLTQCQIAAMSSSTRVTVTRAIAQLVEQDFLRKEKRKLFVNSKYI
jgi:hypothetical protein